MSSGMNVEQAKELAKIMTYSDAVHNVKYGKFIKYRKATMIKLRELAEIADGLVLCKDCKHRQKDVGMGDHGWCDIVNGSRHPDDFCSYGERMTRENEE